MIVKYRVYPFNHHFLYGMVQKWLSLKWCKGALARYSKLTWGSAHAWILKILCYFIVWGITLIFMVRLSFDDIQLLIYDVMNDITIIYSEEKV